MAYNVRAKLREGQDASTAMMGCGQLPGDLESSGYQKTPAGLFSTWGHQVFSQITPAKPQSAMHRDHDTQPKAEDMITIQTSQPLTPWLACFCLESFKELLAIHAQKIP